MIVTDDKILNCIHDTCEEHRRARARKRVKHENNKKIQSWHNWLCYVSGQIDRHDTKKKRQAKRISAIADDKLNKTAWTVLMLLVYFFLSRTSLDTICHCFAYIVWCVNVICKLKWRRQTIIFDFQSKKKLELISLVFDIFDNDKHSLASSAHW